MANDTEQQRDSDGQETVELLNQLRAGHRSALDVLMGRHLTGLRRWARGRLPAWARRTAETADLVQDVLLRALGRIENIEVRGKGALEAYLRRAIQNRIRDEIRTFARRPTTEVESLDLPAAGPSPYDQAVSEEDWRRYRQALANLTDGEQAIVVGALELGYNHEQLAVATGRPSRDSARVALHRALRRLADEMTRV